MSIKGANCEADKDEQSQDSISERTYARAAIPAFWIAASALVAVAAYGLRNTFSNSDEIASNRAEILVVQEWIRLHTESKLEWVTKHEAEDRLRATAFSTQINDLRNNLKDLRSLCDGVRLAMVECQTRIDGRNRMNSRQKIETSSGDG